MTEVIDFDAARAAKAKAIAGAAMFWRGDHAELADALLAALATDRQFIRFAEGAIHVYDENAGTWQACERDELRKVVKSFAGAPKGDQGAVLKVSLDGANGAIAFAAADTSEPDFFAEAPPGVAFSNGFVSLDNGKIVVREHSPDHRARAGFPFAYDPDAPHPKLDAFLDELFADASEDDRAERIALLQEFIGACLNGIATAYQQALVLYGAGQNGKSEVLRLAIAAMPKGTTASLAPQAWSDRFKVEKLAGKLANIVNEIPEREIVGGELFKSIITGDPVTVERKYQDPFVLAPRTGHIFSANALPGTADHSDGFWRRFVVLPFTRRFEGAERRTEAAKAIIEAELPAVVAWAFAGAARLQRQRRYTIPASAVQALDEWRTSADSVASFIVEKTRPVDRSENMYAPGTAASRLYATYREWTEKNGLRPVSSKEFAKRMGNIGKHALKRAGNNFYPVELTSEVPS